MIGSPALITAIVPNLCMKPYVWRVTTPVFSSTDTSNLVFSSPKETVVKRQIQIAVQHISFVIIPFIGLTL